MKHDRNALKAGVFMVVSFIAAAAAVLLIRGEGTGAIQVCRVSFNLADDIGGLSIGDDIRVGGYKVGTVRAVDFEGLGAQSPKVLVKFSLPAGYVLHEDAHINVQTSLTGPSVLNINNLGEGKLLAEGAALAGNPDPKGALVAGLSRAAPHLETIAKNIETQTLPKLNESVAAVNVLLHHANSKIDPIIKEYNDLMVQVREIFGDTRIDIRGTLKNLNLATGTVKDKLPALMDKVTAVSDKVDTMLVNAKTTLEDVQKTAANARDLSAAARSVVVDNRGKLDNMVKALKATSDNLKATSVEVRHSPWRLLYKPAPEEMGNLNLYDSARQFAEGAGSLDDAATALRDAMHDPKTDKAQLQTLMNHLDESFKSFHTAEQKLWTSVKE